MATQNDFSRSFQVNAAMSSGRLVALSNNGYIGYNAINAIPVGVLQDDTTAETYENPKVRFVGTGTARVSVTGLASTAGDVVYSVTNGQVGITNGAGGVGAQRIGILLESTGGAPAGNLFEVLFQIT